MPSKSTGHAMIYVDPLVQHTATAYHGRDAAMAARVGAKNAHLWCHLFTDGDAEELHRFAALLGLKRSWFQQDRNGGHYDLTPGRRKEAIALGAKPITFREAVAIWRRKGPRVAGVSILRFEQPENRGKVE